MTWNMTVQRKELRIEKTGLIGGLDLPEKAEHTRRVLGLQ